MASVRNQKTRQLKLAETYFPAHCGGGIFHFRRPLLAKVKDKAVYHRLSFGEMVEVPGAKRVEIPGYEIVEFFAARLDDPIAVVSGKEYANGFPKEWCVWHHPSGLSLCWAKTLKLAIEQAGERLSWYSWTPEELVGREVSP